MAQPITWHNVNAPAMGNPAQFMQLAQNGIDAGFDKLQGVLKQRETTDAANYAQGGVNNAEAFKSALYGITTPEQMAAAQKSGQFNDMLTGYGANVKDPGALRALMDGRLAALQGQATAGVTFDRTMLAAKNAPKLEEYRTATPERRAEIVAQNPGMAGLGEVVQDTQKFGWEGDKAAAAKLLAPATLASTQAQTNQANAQTANIPKELALREKESLQRQYKIIADAQTNLAEKTGSGSKGTIGASGALDSMITSIQKGYADPKTKEAISSQVSSALQSDPKFADLSDTVVDQIARKHAGNMEGYLYGTNDQTAKIKADLTAALGSKSDMAERAAQSRKELKAQQADMREQAKVIEAKMFPEMVTQRLARDTKTIEDAAKKSEGVLPGAGSNNPMYPLQTDADVRKFVADELQGRKLGAEAPAAKADSQLIQQQAAVEKAEMNLGILKKHSPKVSAYLANQAAEGKKVDAAKMLKSELYNNGYTTAPMGMVYTNEDIQGPLTAVKKQRAEFEKLLQDAKNGK